MTMSRGAAEESFADPRLMHPTAIRGIRTCCPTAISRWCV